MKNKITALAIGLVLLVALAGCGAPATSGSLSGSNEAGAGGSISDNSTPSSGSGASSSDTSAASSGGSPTITAEVAKQAALSHAGLSEGDVVFLGVHLERENKRQVYEVEFYSGNTEYDYDIDASTGEVVSYDYDIENYSLTSGASGVPASGSYIGEDAARSIALAKVTGATESDIRLHLDYDDGVSVYEGSIVYNAMKYEFEIDAVSGNVIEWDVESVYD